MRIVSYIIVLILAVLMFKVKRNVKVSFLYLDVMTLSLVQVPFMPIHGSFLILVVCFILSELPNMKKHLNLISKDVLLWLMSLVIVTTIYCILTSPYLKDGIWNFIQFEIFLKYGVLCYAFVSLKYDNIKPLCKMIYIGLLVLTFFGVINYVTRSAMFVNDVMAGYSVIDSTKELAGDAFAEEDRFRVQSMFFNAFDYGYICMISFLFSIYSFKRKLLNKRNMIVISICSVFGILVCESRTVLLCTIIGVVVQFFYSLRSIKSMIRVVFGTFIFMIISYSTIPLVEEKVDHAITAFDPSQGATKEHGGSSIESRLIQLEAVFYHIKDDLIMGRGVGYFDSLGFKDGIVDRELWGIESVLFSLLLERGFIGLGLYLLFYSSLLLYIFIRRKDNKEETSLALGVLTSFLAFSFMTGELNSAHSTFIIIGFVLRCLYDKGLRIQENNQVTVRVR